MTQILRFEMNVPTEVALKDAGPGKPIEGRYGNRVMYTLTDERVMYVAPIVASRISDLGIQPGELFQVRKQLKRQGSQRLIEWQVERLPAESETKLERDLRESIAVAQATEASQSSEPNEESNPQPPPQGQTAPSSEVSNPAIVPVSNGCANGNGAVAAQDGSSPPSATIKRENTPKTAASAADDSGADVACIQDRTVPPVTAPSPAAVPRSKGFANGSPSSAPKNGNNPLPVTTKLEHALRTAISAAYNAEKYGAQLGYVVRFDADAIKSMAITVLINMSEGNRR